MSSYFGRSSAGYERTDASDEAEPLLDPPTDLALQGTNGEDEHALMDGEIDVEDFGFSQLDVSASTAKLNVP